MSQLFTPFKLRGLEFRNRVVVSPMCQYSSPDGMPTDWHLVHLGSRAVGGAGLVMTEASAITPEGRISPDDAGIWNDAHVDSWRRITRFIGGQGARSGIQLAHAGRKASTKAPWLGTGPVPATAGGWQPMGPSSIPFDAKSVPPREMSRAEIDAVVADFAKAAGRAAAAGFDLVEVHAAHGYLLHEFLSPISNHRTDEYGGSLANRMRLTLRVARAVREVVPAASPLFVRLSVTDWVDGGWDLPQSIELAKELKAAGADLIDCSSGANVADAKIPVGPGYQVPFAEAIRRQAAVATGAVGMITKPEQAEEIIAAGRADVVLLAREMLRDPYWPMHAAKALGDKVAAPKQYGRAW
ncbi:MAG TPA: NADH:flavin oxidoreductase/NADH oxidase [Opitutaceae bacterium]|jgi:2,4-dienoyl-CoA reductase-like NADH-dependent reductase (Old Yellow Enzyme family)